MRNVILENNARSALTVDKSLQLVKPSYGFINTSTIAERFERQGWKLLNASEAMTRKVERQGYQKHLLTFEHDSFRLVDGLSVNNQSRLRISLKNSHDGTSSLELIASVFRLACLNGLMVSAGTLNSIRIVHSGNALKRLDDALGEFTDRLPVVAESIRAMQAITLNADQAHSFADQAARLRLESIEHDHIDTSSVLRPKREADLSSDLYTVFNRIQEKVIRGGISYRTTVSKDEMQLPQWRTSRAVSSIPQTIRLNRELWALAQSHL